jgi:Domain of unknown function (DUF4160)
MGKIYADRDTGFIFYIFTNDHSPPHVHVYKKRKGDRQDKGVLKIAIGDQKNPPTIDKIYSKLGQEEIKQAWRIVAERQEEFLEEWQKYHGNP